MMSGSTPLERYLSSLPEDLKLPKLLIDLFLFYQEQGEEFDVDFNCEDNPLKVANLYFGDPEVATYFLVIGNDSAGSLYGFWLYTNRNLSMAPIVYLESEGQVTEVIANSLEDFLILLGLGIPEIGYFIYERNWSIPNYVIQKDSSFWIWLREKIGVTRIQIPDPAAARGKHPNLGEWLKR